MNHGAEWLSYASSACDLDVTQPLEQVLSCFCRKLPITDFCQHVPVHTTGQNCLRYEKASDALRQQRIIFWVMHVYRNLKYIGKHIRVAMYLVAECGPMGQDGAQGYKLRQEAADRQRDELQPLQGQLHFLLPRLHEPLQASDSLKQGTQPQNSQPKEGKT